MVFTLCSLPYAFAQGKAPTTTTLGIMAGGMTVTSVAQGSVVTLTASVTASGGASTTGQVSFCDAAAALCTDIHLLGMAQLTGAGTAVLRFRPGSGGHNYRALFGGTQTKAPSASAVSSLTVSGSSPASGTYTTATSLSPTGLYTNYTLTASVTAKVPGTIPGITGAVSFVDTTNSGQVLGTSAVGASSAGLSFVNSSTLATPDSYIVLTADLNNDGYPDLVLSAGHTGQTTLAILLGNGDGTFTAASSPTLATYPNAIVAADFNGDGNIDLAVTDANEGIVTILLGRGDGTFAQTAPNLSTLSTPNSLTSADFDGDGIADLAVVDTDSVLIFLGNGDGTFRAVPNSSATGTYPVTVAAGDFNRDGIPDLVVTNDVDPVLTVLLGRGDGTFTPAPVALTTHEGPRGVTVGDLNGDGLLDIAFTNATGENNADAFEILLGKGDGTFNTPQPIAGSGTSFAQILVGDFNGDGFPDLAVGQSYGAATIFTGHGDGTFNAPIPVVAPVEIPSGFLASADFDGDGYPDLAEPDQNSFIPAVAVLLTQPTQTATVTVSGITPVGPGPHQVEAVYAGDTRYLTSTSSPTALVVQVSPPVLSLETGTYTSLQTLSLTDATPNAAIYYQLQGATSVGPLLYTGPVTLPDGGYVFLTTYAVENGYTQSDTEVASYTLNYPPAPAPVLSLVAGTYAGPQTVSITESAANSVIYYTTDGSYPSTLSARYTGPITVSGSETLVAAAAGYGLSLGTPASAQYLIGSAAVPFLYTVAGNGSSGFSGDGDPATVAALNLPQAVVVDGAGNVYIADTNNNVVRKVTAATGVITTVAGSGIAGYTGDGGAAVSAQLSRPVGLALDRTGNLYIADAGNYVIREMTASTGVINTFANNFQANGNGPLGANAEGIVPLAMVFDSAGNLYVSTNSSDVFKVSVNGGPITSVVAAAGNSLSLLYPQGLALDAAGNLYIADTVHSRVEEVNLSTGAVSTVAGTLNRAGTSGDGGPAANALLAHPVSLAFDRAGNLYIADEYQNAVREVAVQTGIISTVVGTGLAESCDVYGGDGGPAHGAALCYPQGIATDGLGNLYIADTAHSRVRKLAPASPVSPATAAPTFSLTGGIYPGPQTLTISDSTPGAAIYVAINGTVSTLSGGYSGPIAITGSASVQAVAAAPGFLASAITSATYTINTPPSAVIRTLAGNGIYSPTPPVGLATSTSLGYPSALARDPAGNLYFTESGASLVWQLSAQTGQISVFAGNGAAGYSGDGGAATSAALTTPVSLAVDRGGNVYIVDSGNNTVRKVTIATGTIATVAGTGSSSEDPATGPATTTSLLFPNSLAVDAAGNLYIGDDTFVRKVDASTGLMTLVTSNAAGNDSGDGGPATNAGTGEVKSLATDTSGNLYIATFTGRVRKITASTGIISTLAGNGNYGTSGDGGPATGAEINPQGIAVDALGNLLIADSGVAIREVSASTGIINRIAGSGYPGYSGDGGAATMAELLNPTGICLDASGTIYFTDASSDVIREVSTPNGATATPVFTPPAGTYTSAQLVTITDSTPGAMVYYTTDGSVPTSTSMLYGGPVAVSSSETLQAIAAATGFTPSAVASASYVLASPVAPPITIKPSAVSISSGQSLTVSANVGSNGQPVPSGTITLSGGNYSMQLGLSAGAATFTIAPGVLSAGTDTLTAVYSPDSASSTVYTTATQTITITVTEVSAAPPTFSLASGSYIGAQTVTIADSTAGATVHYTLDGSTPSPNSPLYGSPLVIAQSATLQAIAVVPGYAESTITSAAFTISLPLSPSVAINLSAASLLSNQALTVRGTVQGGNGKPVATGTLALKAGNFTAQQALSAGMALFSVPGGTLAAGTDTVTVTYAPDAASAPVYLSAAASATVSVIAVGSATVSVHATPAAQTITDQQMATINVTLAGGSGQPTPTGLISVSSGNFAMGQTLTGGATSLTLQGSALSAGANTLTISYSGDGFYAPASTSSAITVAPLVIGSVTPLTVSAGATGSATILFSASSTYAGTLNVSCSLISSPAEAQYPPSCSVSPNQLSIAKSGSASSSLLIQTTDTTVTAQSRKGTVRSSWMGAGVSLCATLACLFWARKPRRRWPALVWLLLLITGAIVGCGGGSPSATTTTRTESTTPGTYSFLVTGTDSVNANITSSVALSVSVP